MAAGDTPGPSGTAGDRYLEDISADELSANAPADETDENRTARRERNRKQNERRRRLRDNLPIRNLAEALDQVESRVHTTPEQCLMSITAQGMRAGEVIAKLAEDPYFMRVDNRFAQVPPVRNRQHDNEATSHSAADNGRNRTRAELPANPNRTRAMAGGPSQGDNSAGTAGGDREIIPRRNPGGGGSGGGSSNHRAGRRVRGGGDHGGRGHANSHVSSASHGDFDARQKIEELRRKKSSTTGDNGGFPAFSSRLCNLLLPEKFKPLAPSTTRSKTPYSGPDAMPSLSRMLVAITTRSASISPSAWIKLRLHGSSHWRSTRSTSGTSWNSSPATSRVLWAARVLAWTLQW
jgi:hypothetical protein